jgi:hypothetical protein
VGNGKGKKEKKKGRSWKIKNKGVLNECKSTS